LPTAESQQKVLALLGQITKGTTPEQLAAKIASPPVVLTSKIDSTQGKRLVAALLHAGAFAVFEPLAPPPELHPETLEEELNAPPTRRNRWRPWAAGLAASCAGVIGWMTWYAPPDWLILLTLDPPSTVSRTASAATRTVNHAEPAQPQSSLPQQSRILTVDPSHMEEAYLAPFALPADRRFSEAAQWLADNLPKLSPQEGHRQRTVAQPQTLGDTTTLLVNQEDQVVETLTLSAPYSFAEMLQTLRRAPQWLDWPLTETSADAESTAILDQAMSAMEKADPPYILEGLRLISEEIAKLGPRPDLLDGAARGYALLAMVIEPDPMKGSEVFISRAMALLALAQGMAGAEQYRETEALVAFVAGYTRHANEVMAGLDPQQPHHYYLTAVLNAYLRQDLDMMGQLASASDEPLIGIYLAVRLARSLNQFQFAESASRYLFIEHSPNRLLSLIALIQTGDLGEARVLTSLYPWILLNTMERAVSPFAPPTEQWKDQIQGFNGFESNSDISLSRFDELATQWHPLEGKTGGPILDEATIRQLFRTLYQGALQLRFNLLYHRWYHLEQSRTFVAQIAKRDNTHPLVRKWRIDIAKEQGEREQAKQERLDALADPATPEWMATQYLREFGYADGDRLLPLVLPRLDSRPDQLDVRGSLLWGLNNRVEAHATYQLLLSKDPYRMSRYEDLAKLEGDDTPIQKGMEQFPNHLTMLRFAAEYYTSRVAPQDQAKAIPIYLTMNRVAPQEYIPMRALGDLALKLHRPEEAIEPLTVWLGQFDTGDLSSVSIKLTLALLHSELGHHEQAITLATEAAESWKADALLAAAEVFHAVGQPEQAQIYLDRVNERYQGRDYVCSETAKIYWQQGRWDDAAASIAIGRKAGGAESSWYRDDFVEAVKTLSIDQLIAAVDALQKQGAGFWEVAELARHLSRSGHFERALLLLDAATTNGEWELCYKATARYRVTAHIQGHQAGMKQLLIDLPTPELRSTALLILYRDHSYAAILDLFQPLTEAMPQNTDWLWQMGLSSWLASDRQPKTMKQLFEDHYAQPPHSDAYYHRIGQFLLGVQGIDETTLLAGADTAKKRCEIAYHIAMHRRIQGDFDGAARWYSMSLAIGSNTGETLWASEELNLWASVGALHRHKTQVADEKNWLEISGYAM